MHVPLKIWLRLFRISDTGECDPDHMSYGGKCYVKTTYTGEEGSRISWFGGQSYCSGRYPDGTIAYSNFHDSTFISSLLNLLGITSTTDVWVGVRKRIWHWRIGKNPRLFFQTKRHDFIRKNCNKATIKTMFKINSTCSARMQQLVYTIMWNQFHDYYVI